MRRMRVRLVRKLADELDGIDVSTWNEGDVIELPRAEARLLIAEGWALPFRGPGTEVRSASLTQERSVAADHRNRRTSKKLAPAQDDA
jgi:hypothetical protein